MSGINLQTLVELIDLGGPVVVILMLMSVYGLAIVGVKLWQFRALRLGDRRFIEPAVNAWRQGDYQGAERALTGRENPIAQAMLLVVKGHAAGIDEVHLREEVARNAARDLNILRRHFRPLEVIGNLAPLLGLLGTVIGMIAAFNQLEAAGSQVDPSVLSGGIWEALLTTAVGLVVAIPAVAMLNFLERHVERLHEDMQDALSRLLTCRALAPLTQRLPTTTPAAVKTKGQQNSTLEGALASAN